MKYTKEDVQRLMGYSDKEILEHKAYMQEIKDEERKEYLEKLRDHFAGQALMGMLASPRSGDYDFIANCAYKMADAMVKAREVK